jgi:hypothetical protein
MWLRFCTTPVLELYTVVGVQDAHIFLVGFCGFVFLEGWWVAVE